MSAQPPNEPSYVTGLIPITNRRPENFRKLHRLVKRRETAAQDICPLIVVNTLGKNDDLTYFQRSELPAARPGSKEHAYLVQGWGKIKIRRRRAQTWLGDAVNEVFAPEHQEDHSLPVTSWLHFREGEEDDEGSAKSDVDGFRVYVSHWGNVIPLLFYNEYWYLGGLWWCDEKDDVMRKACRFLNELQSRAAKAAKEERMIDLKAEREVMDIEHRKNDWYLAHDPFPDSASGFSHRRRATFHAAEREANESERKKLEADGEDDKEGSPGYYESRGEDWKKFKERASKLFYTTGTRPSRLLLVTDHSDGWWYGETNATYKGYTDPDGDLTQEELIHAVDVLEFMQVVDTTDPSRAHPPCSAVLMLTLLGSHPPLGGHQEPVFLRVIEAFWDSRLEKVVFNLLPKFDMSAGELVDYDGGVDPAGPWRALQWLYCRPRETPL